MSLTFQVLGQAGRDNALLVTIDSGKSVSRLLFDCGDGCLGALSFRDVQLIDHLFFSHLHMDHVGGFDTFFRCTYNRAVRSNHLWGPPGTADILQHRFRGFLWNLVGEQQATWRVHDLSPGRVSSFRFELAEAFATAHPDEDRPCGRLFLQAPEYAVEAEFMDHATPSVVYIVREAPQRNVAVDRLTALGLRPGPWLQEIRGPLADAEAKVVVDGREFGLRALQETLVSVRPGASIAYLTDFLLDEAAMDRLTPALHDVGTVICESQYRHADAELARRNHHMTAVQAATLAQRAGIKQLVLFHLSDRYRREEWPELLAEARTVFPATTFPETWRL
jgi:ribonuclease Z